MPADIFIPIFKLVTGAELDTVHDIPSNVTVAGNPAQIINERVHHEFLQNTWDWVEGDKNE